MKTQLTFEEGFDNLYKSYLDDERKAALLDIEGIAQRHLDIGEMSRSYFTKNLPDMSVDQNANANGSLSANNYMAEITKGILKAEGYYLIWHYANKVFSRIRANQLIRAIWDGDVYFHDASGPQTQIPYCWAYSTAVIMLQGRPYGQLYSVPPKRADSFMAQVIETTMDLSQDFAGAISPADLIVNYAWYAKNENLDDKQIQNDLQKFVHVMNNQFRTSGQSPFVNVSLFDRENLRKVFGEYMYPDGTGIDIEYIMHVQKLFGEWFSKGDPASGLPYRFPVCTLNISKDKDGKIQDQDFLEWTCNVNLEKGCFNIYVNDGHKIASCCRLVNDMERMQFRADSFGNGGLNIGSHRVVSINLPRIALKANGDREIFDKELRYALDIARDLLLVHREEILSEE
jgi:ribonucleoside-triphosphate reductase